VPKCIVWLRVTLVGEQVKEGVSSYLPCNNAILL
jgi:hypothetical protein